MSDINSLGHRTRAAVLWNTGFNLFRDLLQFGTMLVLVRLLSPSAYGQFGLVTSVLGVVGILSVNNFLAYTLQVKEERETHYQDHFTAGAVIQGTLFVICNAVGLCFWLFPTYETVAPLIHVMSLSFLAAFPCDFRIKMLERQLEWKRFRILHAIGLLISSFTAVLLAALGAGPYALLCPGVIVTVPFLMDLFFKTKWRPDWTWSWRRYREAWYFGLARAGSLLATNGRQAVESGVLTKLVGFAALGVVNRAVGLAQMFCVKFAVQLLYALYPMLARHEKGSPSFQSVAGLVLRGVAWVVIPLAVSFSLLSAPIVSTVYGAQWLQVIDLLPWSMGLGVATALAHCQYMLLLASQRPNWCLTLDAASLAGTVLNLAFVLPHGLIAYLAAVTLVQVGICCACALLLIGIRCISAKGVAYAVLPAMVGVALALAVCEGAVLISGTNARGFGFALAYGSGFCIIYVLGLRAVFPNQLQELVSVLPGSGRLTRLLFLTQPNVGAREATARRETPIAT